MRKTDSLLIPAGTIIYLYGAPLLVTSDIVVEGNKHNFKVRADETDCGYPVHRIVGRLGDFTNEDRQNPYGHTAMD